MKSKRIGNLLHWGFRLSLLALLASIAYDAHIAADGMTILAYRFVETSQYFHDKMEAHDAPLGDLPNDRPQEAK